MPNLETSAHDHYEGSHTDKDREGLTSPVLGSDSAEVVQAEHYRIIQWLRFEGTLNST